ncbi:CoA-binding protein [Aurantibacter crassamenti]|uniref:CoA-binding protein n=1 Tax=Aurantibacter crassamenti TaxID=1837375 RepID=UPI001939C718|nr:CoA-binding protein [Aurantibacter crassamenti]MBM1106351.1 CoA-binding protein [Aurantibacter crassamenti]
MKKTLVFGASLKTDRYSNLAVNKLVGHNIDTEAFGFKAGQIGSVQIKTNLSDFQNIHTVTLYINSSRQPEYYGGLLKLKPKRVIFNPGTENPEFYKILENNGIEVEVACTLVLLATKQY